MTTTAKDIMSSKVLVAEVGMNIEDAVKLLVKNKITGIPVVNHEGKMVGILSEYDIIANVGKEQTLNPEIFQRSITYTDKVEVVDEDTPLPQILEKFIALKCRRLPVVDKNQRLVGMISRRDIMRVLYYRAKVH